MALKRAVVTATPKLVIQAERQAMNVTFWVPSQVDAGNEATHVFIANSEHECNRYKGVPLLMETKITIPLEPFESIFAVTEDQAILAVVTEIL